MTTWTDISTGSATWTQQETHPYPLLTEASLMLLTESSVELLAYDDGNFWTATTAGSATWSAA